MTNINKRDWTWSMGVCGECGALVMTRAKKPLCEKCKLEKWIHKYPKEKVVR